jgi:hypothetical protein
LFIPVNYLDEVILPLGKYENKLEIAIFSLAIFSHYCLGAGIHFINDAYFFLLGDSLAGNYEPF